METQMIAIRIALEKELFCQMADNGFMIYEICSLVLAGVPPATAVNMN
jgi:hypothetical protein